MDFDRSKGIGGSDAYKIMRGYNIKRYFYVCPC